MDKLSKQKYFRNYYLKNKAKINKYNREYHKTYYKKNSVTQTKRVKEKRLLERKQAMSHYSNGTMSCACCKESKYEFLVFDHIKGNGNLHRRSLEKKYDSRHIARYLIKNNFPDGFQVLCYNCNMAKSFYGKCPHQS